jgi:hypothetical protein
LAKTTPRPSDGPAFRSAGRRKAPQVLDGFVYRRLTGTGAAPSAPPTGTATRRAAAHPTWQPARSARRLGFWSADWTPWPVVAMCRARWPALNFQLRVVYAAD